MTTLEERFQRIVEVAREDPEVVGMAMTGSRGKGFPTATSDYDVMVVVRDGAAAERRRWYEEQGEGKIVGTGHAAPQQRLFEMIDGIAWQHGCGDVLEAWGEDYPWMRSYRPDGAGEQG